MSKSKNGNVEETQDKSEEIVEKKEEGVVRLRLNLKRKKVELFEDEDSTGERLPIPPGIYTLVELVSTEKDDYVNQSLDRNKIDSKTGVRVGYDVKDLDAILVTKCIRSPEGQTIPLQKIRALPSGTLSELYAMCEDLCGISKMGADKAKKA